MDREYLTGSNGKSLGRPTSINKKKKNSGSVNDEVGSGVVGVDSRIKSSARREKGGADRTTRISGSEVGQVIALDSRSPKKNKEWGRDDAKSWSSRRDRGNQGLTEDVNL